MWNLIRPDFGKLTKNQDLKIREASIMFILTNLENKYNVTSF